MAATPAQILAELSGGQSPLAAAYAPLLEAGDDAGLAAALNLPRYEGASPRWVTELGVLDILGPDAGEAFLQGLESVAIGNPVVARVLRIIKQSSGVGNPQSGIDLGSAAAQAMLASLEGVLGAAPCQALAAAGRRSRSRAEALWGDGTVVTFGDVAAALLPLRAL